MDGRRYSYLSLRANECALCSSSWNVSDTCLQPLQSGGVGARWRQRSVGAAYIPPAAHTQVGPLPAGSSLPARRHAAHHGQRCHVLCASRPLHLHLQVSVEAALSVAAFCQWNTDSAISFDETNWQNGDRVIGPELIHFRYLVTLCDGYNYDSTSIRRPFD